MKVEVNGADELADKLLSIGELRGLRRVVKENGLSMQRHAKIVAPVDTGFLKRMIRMSIEDGGFTARVTSGDPPYYAIYQERWYTPHIRPAFYRQEKKFLRDVRDAIHAE